MYNMQVTHEYLGPAPEGDRKFTNVSAPLLEPGDPRHRAFVVDAARKLLNKGVKPQLDSVEVQVRPTGTEASIAVHGANGERWFYQRKDADGGVIEALIEDSQCPPSLLWHRVQSQPLAEAAWVTRLAEGNNRQTPHEAPTAPVLRSA